MVVMEIMHFHCAYVFIIEEKMLCLSGVPMNDRKSMKIFKVGQISPQGMLICNKLKSFIYVNNTN